MQVGRQWRLPKSFIIRRCEKNPWDVAESQILKLTSVQSIHCWFKQENDLWFTSIANQDDVYQKLTLRQASVRLSQGCAASDIWEMCSIIQQLWSNICEMCSNIWQMWSNICEMCSNIWQMYSNICEMCSNIREMCNNICAWDVQ